MATKACPVPTFLPPAASGSTALMVALLVLLLGSDGVVAQDSPPDGEIAERCRDPVHRAFDFWIGVWQVRDGEGDPVGRNEIRRVAHGCALLESWRGAGGSQGVSVSSYDPDRSRWTQRWVGDGSTLWLEGGMEDERMVLSGTDERSTPRGAVLDRIEWSPLPDGRVLQVWTISRDGGSSWDEVFRAFYVRVERDAG